MKKIKHADGHESCPNCHQTIVPAKAKWHHWFIEWCPQCQCNTSQGPVAEDVGEDCLLFEKIDSYDRDQRHNVTNFTCLCGTKTVAKYRHATADWNCLTENGEPVEKAPLLPGQAEGEGTFIDRAEYEKKKQGHLLEQQLLKQTADK